MRQFCILLFFSLGTTLGAAAHPHNEATVAREVPSAAHNRPKVEKLEVTGLISSRAGPKAILRRGSASHILTVGDQVGEMKVLEIDNNSVTLNYRGDVRRLPLKR